jgi:hypothetical protein
MMLLTAQELNFLTVFIHEATTDPFKGPATEELHRRNIFYNDLSNLMAAYYLEGSGTQEDVGGRPASVPPPCPWSDREMAVRRNAQVRIGLETAAHHVVS